MPCLSYEEDNDVRVCEHAHACVCVCTRTRACMHACNDLSEHTMHTNTRETSSARCSSRGLIPSASKSMRQPSLQTGEF